MLELVLDEPLLILAYLGSFSVIALASKQIGEYLSRLNLPLISGYLLAGIIAGPFVLGMISPEVSERLAFLNDIALGFIAFAAGSELYLKELSGRWRSIGWYALAQAVAIFFLGGTTVFLLSDFIPFMREMSPSARGAVAVLAGAILVVRSPSSAIAVVNELRARGPFTKTVLGVTVVMDVVVVFLFAFATSLADVLLTAGEFEVGFILLLAVELSLSLLCGYVVARFLQWILALRSYRLLKIVLILTLGFGVFVFSHLVREYTHEHWAFEVLLEPLLICMVAGFLVTNFSAFRDEFHDLLSQAGPLVYVAFFTLIGDTLRLDILAQTLLITVIIFGVRWLGLLAGSWGGGMLAGDSSQHSRLSSLAYITQAGIGLGLAAEAAAEFPELGNEFSTLIVLVIVLSQLVGPPFLKMAIKRVGESHLPGQTEPDRVRDALILGIDHQSLALARQLKASHWEVSLADTDPIHVDSAQLAGVAQHYVPEITKFALAQLISSTTDAVVVMCGDDEVNYRTCELAYEFGVPRMIVRLNDVANSERFRALGALVVDPASAMVNLLDQFVRVPQTASLLMHLDPAHEIAQITLIDPDIDGKPLRDLRLPGDVLVLGVTRSGQSIVPHGHTILHLYDEVTLVGDPRSLDQVTVRMGF